MRATVAASLVLLAAMQPGCMYFARSPIRPMPALAFYADATERAHCLVVILPGLMDGPETVRDQRLFDVLWRAGARCDVVAVDATYRYYFGGRIDEVLAADVLVPARARGYDETWIVGVSLGALGALLTARARPELVDGVIVLSPFLGLEEVLGEIEAAGGLREWRPPEVDPRAPPADGNFTAVLWAHLRRYATEGDGLPPLYVGWADGERLARGAGLVADVLPESHAAHCEGGHGWATWTPLLSELASRAHIGGGPPH